jgi:hypothetical protein
VKPGWRLAFLGAVAAIGYFGWRTAFPSPRVVIKHRLESLAKTASFTAEQGQLVRLAKMQKLAGYFAENVEVKVATTGVDQHTFDNRDELLQAAGAAAAMARSLRVQFFDQNVEVDPGRKDAIDDLAMQGGVGDDKDFIEQELKFTLKKIDGAWVITRIESVQ